MEKDAAEDMAKRHIPMTVVDWSKRIDKFLELTDRPVLTDAEKITAEFAKSSLNRSLRNFVSLRTNSFSQTSTISTMTTFSL